MSVAAPSDQPAQPHAELITYHLERVLHQLGFELLRHTIRKVFRRDRRRHLTLLLETHVYRGTGGEHVLHVGMTTEDVDGAAAAATEVMDGRVWSVWIHPNDPLLPGLSLVARRSAVIERFGNGAPLLSLRTISYRPLHRAVVRADFGASDHNGVDAHTLYLKVVPLHSVDETAELHRMLDAAGLPVAQFVSRPRLGVLALDAVPGQSLAQLLMQRDVGQSAVWPERIREVLDALPAAVLQFPRRIPWAERLDEFVPGLATVLPEEQLMPVLERVHIGLRTDPGPVVPVHGDLYEAHLLFGDGGLTGLLDIDGVGPGHRVDDLACLLGHLTVLPTVDARYRAVDQQLAMFRDRLAPDVDPVALAARTAAVVLTLVPTDTTIAGTATQTAQRSQLRQMARRRLSIAEAILHG